MTILVATMVSAFAADTRIRDSLRKLDPATRFDQVCDLAAMKAIKRDPNRFRPDRAVGSAVEEARIVGNRMEGKGGAFRSNGQWYQFSFTCTVTPDRMDVTAFSYKLGEPIPESKWASYNLWR